MALKEMAALEGEIVIVGSGFIAVEAAAALRQAKCKVSLLTRDAALWSQFLDADTAAWLTGVFRQHGVTLHLQESLNGFEGKTVLRNIQTKNGNRYPAALALVAVGGEMNLELVRNTPLSSPKGTPVNEFLETDEKGIYAAGRHRALSRPHLRRGAPDRPLGKRPPAGSARRREHDRQKAPALRSPAAVHERGFRSASSSSSATSAAARPLRHELEGSREKKSFIVRYFQGDKLRGGVSLQPKPERSRRDRKGDPRRARQAVVRRQAIRRGAGRVADVTSRFRPAFRLPCTPSTPHALRHHPARRHPGRGHQFQRARQAAHRRKARRLRDALHRGRLAGVQPEGRRLLRGRQEARFRHAKLAAFGSTRRANLAVENDPQVALLLEAADAGGDDLRQKLAAARHRDPRHRPGGKPRDDRRHRAPPQERTGAR